MRYFWIPFILLCVTVVSIAGFRGDKTDRTPIELFSDMDRQPKLRPQEPNPFFANGRSSQPQVDGTVARAEAVMVNGKAVYPFEDHPFNTGREAGATNFIATLPIGIDRPLLERGRERYEIHCAVCHGTLGDGQGAVSKLGVSAPANFHAQLFVEMTDGQMFDIISHGTRDKLVDNDPRTMRMSGYAASIDVRDRWAIVAYVRALQRGRLGSIEDVPAPNRGQLDK